MRTPVGEVLHPPIEVRTGFGRLLDRGRQRAGRAPGQPVPEVALR